MSARIAILGLVLACAFGLLAAGQASAEEPKVGKPAPDFQLEGTDGRGYTLEDFKGKKAVVLAWFPRAFTPG